MLELVRLSRRRVFPPGGPELYRQIALLAGLAPGEEVLAVACGKGVSLEYFVREHGVVGSGVDPDPWVIGEGERFVRQEGLGHQMSFQRAPADDLPFRDGIFDLAVGELGLAARVEPERAVGELVRVTKPGGWVALVQLVWKTPVDEARARLLAGRLGARPLMLVELRKLLVDAGVRQLHTEDWSGGEAAAGSRVGTPFFDFARLFTVRERLGILGRAWGRWGWRGARALLQREVEVHRLLARERILGLSLVMGVRAGGGGGKPLSRAETEPAPRGAGENAQTEGLPLFSGP